MVEVELSEADSHVQICLHGNKHGSLNVGTMADGQARSKQLAITGSLGLQISREVLRARR
jgi:hypothetical protein